jgi:vesicle-associated membrane protein 4
LNSDDENGDENVIMNKATASSDKKLANLKSQVNDVIGDMKINIDKVVERGQNLNELNDRSESLGVAGDLFSKRSRNLRKSMWFRTCRSRLYLSIGVSFIFFVFLSKPFFLIFFSKFSFKIFFC